MSDALKGFYGPHNSPSPSASGQAAFKPKIVLVGAQGVGKTSILLRQEGKGFTSNISGTIGASFCYLKIGVDDGTHLEIQVWDTAGQERFRSMAPMYYRNAVGAICVYDVTCQHSLNELKGWVDELQRNCTNALSICIMGNKTDLEERQISTEEGRAYASSIGAGFAETSALKGTGILSGFRWLAQSLVDSNTQTQSLFTREPLFLSSDNDSAVVSQKSNKKACHC